MTTTHAALTPQEFNRALQVRNAIDIIESDIGSKFYGLENVTAKGKRRWTIAPRPPHVAIDAIKGNGAPAPIHIVKRWCNTRRAWRSIDLTTTTRIDYTDSDGTKRAIHFA